MTCYLILLLVEKFSIDINKTYLEVSSNSTSMIGTSALLQTDSWCKIIDLLYAMMLPSGNDSA